MRMRFALPVVCSVFLSAVLALSALAQNPETMMPEQSEAKAKQIIQDLINARGAAGYLNATESECHGTRAQFGHSGAITGYIPFTESRLYPDKERLEFTAKSHNLKNIINTVIGVDGLDLANGGVIVALYNGNQGWTLDRGGITELPATTIADFQEQVKRNIDNVLRVRLKEPGWTYRYGGIDTVDLKEVDWVELTDPEQRTFRLAVDRLTKLLVRSVVITDNQETREHDEDVNIYSNYQLKGSVWTPMQVTRLHNDRQVAQFFLDACAYNPGFASDFFDRDSLKKRFGAAKVKKSKQNVDNN